jgi:hypothetical protein
MFQSLARILAGQGFGDGTISNALLEAFAVHARAILGFIYPPKDPHETDVLASHFFTDDAKWREVHPPRSDAMKEVHDRVGKEVAHLTYDRQKLLTDDAKQWKFLEIEREIMAIIKIFVELAPRELLGSRWGDDPTKAFDFGTSGDAHEQGPVTHTNFVSVSILDRGRSTRGGT